jgi:hypothetical protein
MLKFDRGFQLYPYVVLLYQSIRAGTFFFATAGQIVMTTALSDYWDALAWERSGPKRKLTAAQVKKVQCDSASISIPHKSSRTAELNTGAIQLNLM